MVLRTSPADNVTLLLLDEPHHRNAIDHATVDELEECLLRGAAAVVVLGSAHEGVFCAGGDLSLDDDDLRSLSDRIYDLCSQLLTSSTVFIVAANGLAVGSGAQLFIAADLRVVGPKALLRPAVPERGLATGAWSLPVAIGRQRALTLLLTGATLPADELVGLGFASQIHDDPILAATELASDIARLDPAYRTRVKRAVTAAAAPASAAIAVERSTFTRPGPVRESS